MPVWTHATAMWRRHQRAWLERRIPKAARYQLDNRSIFILPTRFGTLYVVVTLLIYIIASNYQHTGLIVISYFMLAVFVIHLFSSYLNFSRLHVSIGHINPVFAGTTAAVPLTMLPHQSLRKAKGTLWVNFMLTAHADKPRYQAIELDTGATQYNIRYFAQHRGVYPLPRMTLQCDYPLGLFRCWTHLQFTQTLTVYPSPVAGKVKLEHIAQLSDATQPDATHGVAHAQRDEFRDLSAYQVGDPLHSVAWKQLAKTGTMLTKNFTGYSVQRGYLTLPLHGDIESALSQLAYQINQSHMNRDIYGVFLPHITLPPDNSESHRITCLQALAEFPQHTAVDAQSHARSPRTV